MSDNNEKKIFCCLFLVSSVVLVDQGTMSPSHRGTTEMMGYYPVKNLIWENFNWERKIGSLGMTHTIWPIHYDPYDMTHTIWPIRWWPYGIQVSRWTFWDSKNLTHAIWPIRWWPYGIQLSRWTFWDSKMTRDIYTWIVKIYLNIFGIRKWRVNCENLDELLFWIRKWHVICGWTRENGHMSATRENGHVNSKMDTWFENGHVIRKWTRENGHVIRDLKGNWHVLYWDFFNFLWQRDVSLR